MPATYKALNSSPFIMSHMDVNDNSLDGSEPGLAPGSGVAAPTPPAPDSNEILQAIQALNIQGDQPAMHNILSKLASGINNIALANEDLEQKQKTLLEATRKHKMEAFVKSLTNPMSARAVRHICKVGWLVDDLLAVFAPDGVPFVPTDLPSTCDIIEASVSVMKEMKRLLSREQEMHRVAQVSPLGWRTVAELDKKEVDMEEKEDEKVVTSALVTSAENSFMAYTLALSKAKNFSQSTGKGGKTPTKKYPRKKPSKAPKDSSLGVQHGKASGRVSKPRYGGCHRCGGPHFVRACPKPIAKD